MRIAVTVGPGAAHERALFARRHLEVGRLEAAVTALPQRDQVEVIGPLESVLYVVEVLWRLDQGGDGHQR